MRIAVLAVTAVAAVGGCSAATPEATELLPDGLHAPWTRDAAIYEINVRQYTAEGTFAALQEHLPRLRDLGVEILWLMPVQPIGQAERKGSLGSYYSIRDYTAINPEFGTLEDFIAFVDAAHALNMKVILDWVANHTAFDHPWTVEHPDWYTRRPDGSISVAVDLDGRETDWTDVADLNYESPDMRQAMLAAMQWWLDETGIDGFRCDVAGFVPYDFWAEMRSALTARRGDLFLLAEWEDPALHEWFDMTYGWEFHHILNLVARGEAPVDTLDAYLAKQDSLYPDDAYRMYFTSNHDENSWSGSEYERMGANHAPAFVLSATIEDGMPLVYTGQEAGLNRRLRFFDKDTVSWSDTTMMEFYREVLALKRSQDALRNGAWGGPMVRLATDGHERVYAFARTRGENTVVVAVNFGAAPAAAAYESLPHPGEYTDWFDGAAVTLAGAGVLEIPAHGWRVLVR